VLRNIIHMATCRHSSRSTTAPTSFLAVPCITSHCASATSRTRLKPSLNPAPTLLRTCVAQGQGPHVGCHPLLGFSPARVRGSRWVHFAPQQPAEPHREPFSPGQPPGNFALPPLFSTTPLLGPPAIAERCPDYTSRPPSSWAWGEPSRNS
jgi:hypothetical protein